MNGDRGLTLRRMRFGFGPTLAVCAAGLLAAPVASAVDSAAACKAFTETFIEENQLLPARDARDDAFSMCLSGLQGAQRLLEVSTAENMAHCDLDLNSYLSSRGLGVPKSDNWREAMTLCANGDSQNAKLYLAEAQLSRDNMPSPVPRPAPPPSAEELTRRIVGSDATQAGAPVQGAPSIGRSQAAVAEPQLAQETAPPTASKEPSSLWNFFGDLFGEDTAAPPAAQQQAAPERRTDSFSVDVAPQRQTLSDEELNAARGAARATTLAPPPQTGDAFPRAQTIRPPAAPLETPPAADVEPAFEPAPSFAPPPADGLSSKEIEEARRAARESMVGDDLPEATTPTPLVAVSQPRQAPPTARQIMAQAPAPILSPASSTPAAPREARSPRTIDQCIPLLDRVVVDEWLSPNGLEFQDAVGRCMKGDMDAARGVLRASHAKTAARCEPLLNGYIAEMGLSQPGRMLWKTAMDLCANGRDVEAQNELTRVGFAERPASPASDRRPAAAPRAEEKTAMEPVPAPRAPAATVAPHAAPPQGGGGPSSLSVEGVPVSREVIGNNRILGEGDAHLKTSRSACVSEINAYMLQNDLLSSQEDLEKAIALCRDGRVDQAKASLGAAHEGVIAQCEAPLYQFAKQRGIEPSKRWWYGAMTLCGDGDMKGAQNMLLGSVPVTESNGRRVALPDQVAPGQQRAPIPRDAGSAMSLVPPAAPQQQGVDCVSMLDDVIRREDLTPSNKYFQKAAEACANGDMTRMRTVIREGSAEARRRCEPELRGHLADRGLAQPNSTTWKNALLLCANSEMTQAKALLGE